MILKTKSQKDYELIDSGNGHKLERYGEYTLVRPDPEALWQKTSPESVWKEAHLEFERTAHRTKWIIKDGVKRNWTIEFGNLNFQIHLFYMLHIASYIN